MWQGSGVQEVATTCYLQCSLLTGHGLGHVRAVSTPFSCSMQSVLQWSPAHGPLLAACCTAVQSVLTLHACLGHVDRFRRWVQLERLRKGFGQAAHQRMCVVEPHGASRLDARLRCAETRCFKSASKFKRSHLVWGVSRAASAAARESTAPAHQQAAAFKLQLSALKQQLTGKLGRRRFSS